MLTQPTPAEFHDPKGPPSEIPDPKSLPDQDRHRLALLFRTHGDTVAMCGLREEDPLELLHWLDQPHIKPFHDAIRAAHREHRHNETHLSLMRALKDITRILDLEADSTLRIRAVNAVIRLANAIHRQQRVSQNPSRREGQGWVCSTSDSSPPDATSQALPNSHLSHEPPLAHSPSPAHRAAKELHRATERVEDAASNLKIHLERRAYRQDDLADAKAPLGTKPTSAAQDPYWFPLPFGPSSLPTDETRAPPTRPAALPSPESHDSHQSHPPSRTPLTKRATLQKAGCPIPRTARRRANRR
jgi:hypothetical protein